MTLRELGYSKNKIIGRLNATFTILFTTFYGKKLPNDKIRKACVLIILASPYIIRHFQCLVVFRSSRAFAGLFTTRLAKMADAQVCSGKRRGGFKAIFLHINELTYGVILTVCLYKLFIHVHEGLQHIFKPL